jgi:hypothetical protein
MATMGTVRDVVLRVPVEELPGHLATLETELGQVPLIEVVRGERVIAEMRAPKQVSEQALPIAGPVPDFRAQMREVFGDRVLDVDTASWIREDRDGGA